MVSTIIGVIKATVISNESKSNRFCSFLSSFPSYLSKFLSRIRYFVTWQYKMYTNTTNRSIDVNELLMTDYYYFILFQRNTTIVTFDIDVWLLTLFFFSFLLLYVNYCRFFLLVRFKTIWKWLFSFIHLKFQFAFGAIYEMTSIAQSWLEHVNIHKILSLSCVELKFSHFWNFDHQHHIECGLSQLREYWLFSWNSRILNFLSNRHHCINTAQ